MHLETLNYKNLFIANKRLFFSLLVASAIEIISILLFTSKNDITGYYKLDRPDGVVYVSRIGLPIIVFSSVSIIFIGSTIFIKALLAYINQIRNKKSV